MTKREQDLGRVLQKVGRRLEDEGKDAAQLLYDWRKEAKIEADSNRGGGGGVTYERADRQLDRHAAGLHAEFVKVRTQLDALAGRMGWLLDQAKRERRPLDKHRTPAQVEADGNCGSCWKSVGEIVLVTRRPSGEPYYRGRCRFCGSWPGGDPPAEVLRQRLRTGKDPMVKVS